MKFIVFLFLGKVREVKTSFNFRACLKNTLVFLLLGSLFYFVPPVQAHFIENDGSVLVMLHADPDDNPIIGQPAKLTFYITDSQKKFNVSDCDCRLEISLNDQIVLSTTTFKNVKNNPVFSYTFSHKGIYSIHFTASSLVNEGFKNFFLDYDMRVERTAEQVVANNNYFYRLYLILGIVILFVILVFKYKNKKYA